MKVRDKSGGWCWAQKRDDKLAWDCRRRWSRVVRFLIELWGETDKTWQSIDFEDEGKEEMVLFIEKESGAGGIKSSIWIVKLELVGRRCWAHHGPWMGISKQMIIKHTGLALMRFDIWRLGRGGTKRGERKTRRSKSINERVSEKRRWSAGSKLLGGHESCGQGYVHWILLLEVIGSTVSRENQPRNQPGLDRTVN